MITNICQGVPLSKSESSPIILASVQSVSENGKDAIRSNLQDLRKEQDSLILKKSSEKKNLNKKVDLKSFTVESPLENKRMISTDKSNSPKKNIQNTKSFQISDPVLTGKEKDLEESWICQHQERLKKLSSFTEIDYVDLASKFLSTSSTSTKQDSWFTNKVSLNPEVKNSQKTSLLSPIFSHALTTEKESIRTKKIKIYPTKTQIQTLKQWFDHHRFTYNLAVESSKKNGYTSNLKMMEVRKPIVNKDYLSPKNLFLVGTPYDIRGGAVMELCAKHQSEVTKYRKYGDSILKKYRSDLEKKIKARDNSKTEKTKNKHQDRISELEKIIENHKGYLPNIRFRQKKSKRLVIDIPHAKCKTYKGEKKINIYTRTLGDIRTKERIDTLQHDIKVCWDKSLGWYLLVPYTKPNKDYSPTKKFISIDPGYRTFLTGVDSEGNVQEYGTEWYKEMKDSSEKRKQMAILRENSKDKENYTNKERQRFRILSLRTKETIRRIETKNLNKVDYMHKKISSQLLNEFETILLPKINSKRIVSEGNLSSSVNRMVMMGAQCKFHDYISFQGNSRILNVDERYTTKVCTNCTKLNDIGSSKTYECSGCNFKSDRDVNSAINILVKNMDELQCLSTVDNADAC